MAKDCPNNCEILLANEWFGEFRGGFVCLNDSLQDRPNVVILYVAMVIFVMIFLKVVTRPQLVRNSGNTRDGEP